MAVLHKHLAQRDVAVLQRVSTRLNALGRDLGWSPAQFGFDPIPHRYVSAPSDMSYSRTWKEAKREYMAIQRGVLPAEDPLGRARVHKDLDTPRSDEQALALSQVYSPYRDLRSNLSLQKEILERQAQRAEGRGSAAMPERNERLARRDRVQSLLNLEDAIDTAISIGNARQVERILVQGVHFTPMRLQAALTSAAGSNDQGPRAVADIGLAYVASMGLTPAEKRAVVRGYEQAINGNLGSSPSGPAIAQRDWPLLASVRRAGFSLTSDQLLQLVSDPDPQGMFTALDGGISNPLGLTRAVLAMTILPTVRERGERIRRLTAAGANVNTPFSLSETSLQPFTEEALCGVQAPHELPSLVWSLSLPEPVLPLLHLLETLGVDVTASSPDGYNAWHGLALGWASDGAAVARLLTSRNVPINQFAGARRLTPLGALLCQGQANHPLRNRHCEPLLPVFLQAGASTRGFQRDRRTVWDLTASSPANRLTLLAHRAVPPRAVLVDATLNQSDDLFRATLAGKNWRKADLGETAIRLVRWSGSASDALQRLGVLFEKGAPINFTSKVTPCFFYRPQPPNRFPHVAYAVSAQLDRRVSMPLLEHLHRHGVDMRQTSSRGETAWHFLARSVYSTHRAQDWEQIATFLSEKGVPITAATTDGTGITPLHLLLDEGGNSRVTDAARQEALRVFSAHGATEGQTWASDAVARYQPVAPTALSDEPPLKKHRSH